MTGIWSDSLRRRLSLFLISALCAAALTGCSASPTPQADAQTEISGEIHDTGEFQVLVPEGWHVFPITDPFTEGQPVQTDCVFLRKGGESDRKVTEKPYMRINHYGPGRQMEDPYPDPAVWCNVEDISPMQTGDLVWNGCTADSKQGRASIGRFAILWTKDGEHQYLIVICLKSGGASIKLADADLQAILTSLEPSNAAV